MGRDMQTIRLERAVWTFDENEPLGPAGGFGEVFKGRGQNGEVAVKRLKINAGKAAYRELSVGTALANRGLKNVVPVLDAGQDAESDRYFLVMPVCDFSLQDAISKKGPLPWPQARQALLDIVEGLLETSDLVHRDLKPGNVLWKDGRWWVADFGIAKFVEDVTSLETLRESLTPSYAAPEQWRGERPTHATDVYALGCIAYAVLTGSPPFAGDLDSVRTDHLHKPPAEIAGINPRLAGLLATMLRKSQDARPTLSRVRAVLTSIDELKVSEGRSALAEAGAIVSKEQAIADAIKNERLAADRRRKETSTEAMNEFRGIVSRFFDLIESHSDNVQRAAEAIVLGPAHLIVHGPKETPPVNDAYGNGWEIVAEAAFHLRAEMNRVSYNDPPQYIFQATLVFAKTRQDPEFRWREMSFFPPFANIPMSQQPMALSASDREFAIALSNTLGSYQLAHGPFLIDAEDEQSFLDRWATLFAKAATGKLRPPNNLPLIPQFFKP